MHIKNYTKEDEKEWLKCRLLSFFDCSYYDNVVRKKDEYDSNSINLVAIEDDIIIGFIDIEIEKMIKEVCYLNGELGGVIWDLGVLPEYRNQKIATLLLEEAIKLAKEKGVSRFEAWTQDDVASNKWYINNGFKYIEGYLNVFAEDKSLLDKEKMGKIFGVRSINFEAPLERKDELVKKYDRVHEVKLYELKF